MGELDGPRPVERPGIELDEAAAQHWKLAVAASDPDEIGHETATGVFGDRVALLDFDPEDLAHLRRLVPRVRLVAHPAVESAIAISGSSAQGAIQLFPGDADFFERAHIRASSRDEAARVLRDVLRATALRALTEPDVVLVEANLGVFTEAAAVRGRPVGAGDPVTWLPADVEAGLLRTDAGPGLASREIQWDEVDVGRGWVYLGWIVADRAQARIRLASLMVDATWEDDAGKVHALDGAIDPLAQEIYLDPAVLPLVNRLDAEVPARAHDAYREAMRSESRHYAVVAPHYAKAAKRIYNLCRADGLLDAAAYVRELFDEPAARLYQVPGLLEAADHALDPASGIDKGIVLAQLELVAGAIAEVTDGALEAALVADVARLKRCVTGSGPADEWADVLAAVSSRSSALVDEFFRERLFANDAVREVIDSLRRAV